jgi:hypothetical protein
MEYLIRQYELEQGALEIQYIEEFFGEFPHQKTAAEIIERLSGRPHLILMAEARLPDSGALVPVSYKVCHELNAVEHDPRLIDLVAQVEDCVTFAERRVLYSWIGGTRTDWRGQGHFRALTEQQEVWAVGDGFDEMLVKTKNKFYAMRAALDHLQFDVVKFAPHPVDNRESKVFLSKKLGPHVIASHRSTRNVIVNPV